MSCASTETKMSPIAMKTLAASHLGWVHSIFAHSLNLTFNGHLVHIGAAKSELSSFGVTVSSKELSQVLAAAEQNDICVIKDNEIFIYCTSGVKKLSLKNQLLYNLELQKIDCSFYPVLLSQIKELKVQEKTGLEVDPRLWRDLWPNSYSLEAKAKKLKAIKWFIGRGIGLTPSGDDMLLGFGAGLILQGFDKSYFRALAQNLNRQTTDVSLAYLSALLQKNVNESYIELSRSMQKQNEEELFLALTNIQAFGHSSGSDGLYGLAMSFQVNPHIRNNKRRIVYGAA